ncbi:MAG: peptide chain release factor N(5)-glutamine methyltransferase [Solirubrobacteraceae bacterium]
MPPAEVLGSRRGPVGLALATGRDLLAAAGCDTPGLDAELLLAEVLGVGRARLVIDRGEMLPEAAWARFASLLARREAREPVAYILGRRAFRRLELAVDRRVLIPRPETELLVEVGLELDRGASVVDVGTGSGAVALALKDERADLHMRGIDVSADALEVARGNAVALGLDVTFLRGDLLEGVPPADAVLANLPYVAEGAALPPEITRYEPAGALFAGADGLEVIRRLVFLVAGPTVALLALEIAPEQAVEVERLLGDAGFGTVGMRRDLAGLERVVVGTA